MNLSNKNTSEPAIPGPTCKYVDHIIRVLTEEVKPMIKDTHKDFYGHVLSTLKGELELLRESNRQLREVGKYYKKKSK